MINLRSPYFVVFNKASIETATLELFVHTGAEGSPPVGTVKYTLSATAIDNAGGTPEVVFDISELARDYIETNFDGTYASDTVWVQYRITSYISGTPTSESYVKLTGFDGYRYFEDGVQSSVSTYTAPDLLQSNTVIYKSDDNVIRVPVLQDNVTDVTFLYKGEIMAETAITPSAVSTSVIRYPSNTGASYDTFKARVAADSGTFEEACVGNVFNRYCTQPCDAVILTTSSSSTKLTVKDISEPKHTPYKLTFVNKFGAYQDIWFFKKSKLSLAIKEETYKANIVVSGAYSVDEHQKKVLRRKGGEGMRLNSGYYPESYNEVFKQLLLSEQVWIYKDAQTLPVNIQTNAVEFKSSVNDKLINYTIDIQFAYDKINNIR